MARAFSPPASKGRGRELNEDRSRPNYTAVGWKTRWRISSQVQCRGSRWYARIRRVEKSEARVERHAHSGSSGGFTASFR